MHSVVYYVLNLLTLAAMVYALRSYSHSKVNFFWLVLFIKLTAGIALGLVYTNYYSSGDTFSFFEEANRIADLARSNLSVYFDFLMFSDATGFDIQYSWKPNVLFTKIVSVFCLITGGNYWLVSLYFSFFSFSALWYLYQLLIQLFSDNKLAVGLGLFGIPSFVFWTSGLLKESISIICISIIVGIYLKQFFLNKRTGILHWIAVVVSIILLWNLKYFYAGPLLVTLITGLLVLFLSKREIANSPTKILLTTSLISLGTLLLSTLAHPNFYLSRILQVIVDNHDSLLLRSGEGAVRFNDLSPSIASLFEYLPLALFSGFFRPLFWDVTSLISWGTAIENTVLLLLAIWALISIRRNSSDKKLILVAIAFLYILVLATLLALSTPNFGTLVRFKVGFLPFLWMLVLYNNSLIRRLSDRFFN